MYVIFPLDELLDLNSAKENKRGRETLDKQSQTRHTEKVLPLSQPNQKLPNQLKPPLSQQPKTPQQQQQPPPQLPQPKPQPQPTATKQQKTPTPPPQPQPQQPPPPSLVSQSQKPTLSKAPSKSSLTVNPPPSIVVPPQSPVSVPSSNQPSKVKKPLIQQTAQPQPQPQPPPDQVTKRQRSSHSTSTETSSTSSTGAKGKALLSPLPSGGAATNRSSWGGGPVTLQESCPARTGSFKACKDLTVVSDGNSLKVVEQSRASSIQDIRGSTLSVKPPLTKSNSFRSHLSDSYACRPRQVSVEAIKKQRASPSPPVTSPTQPLPPSDIPRRSQESVEQPLPTQEPKASEAVTSKQEIPLHAVKEKQSPGVEGVKIKQEVPVQAPPPLSPSHKQITTAESLRIQQDCLASQAESRALSPNQRHLSGRSNRSSGSQKLSDLPPSGSGGGSRGAAAAVAAGAVGSANPNKNQGVLGSPRGLQPQQRNTVMASNEGYRDLTNPGVNESLKAHNAFTFKLVKTGSSSGALEESQSLDETTDHHHQS